MGATTLAVTVAAVTVLQVLQGAVDSFNPRAEISVLIVLAVSFATLALSVLRQRMARDGQLEDALRSWPLPSAERADPYRHGVFPPRGGARGPGEHEYASRGRIDEDLKSAIRTSQSGFVLVTGPRGVGKSRAALEAIRRALPDALVVAPEDGQALRALFDLDPPLFSRRSRLPKWSRSSRAVLWLDGLNRFLEEIDAKLLDEVRASAIPVTIVATIREEDYEAALEGSGNEAEGAKAVAAAAEEFSVPDRQSPAGPRAAAQRTVRP